MLKAWTLKRSCFRKVRNFLSVMANIMLAIQLHPSDKNKALECTKRRFVGRFEGTENKPARAFGGQKCRHLALRWAAQIDEAAGYCLCHIESKVVIWVTHTPEEVKPLLYSTAKPGVNYVQGNFVYEWFGINWAKIFGGCTGGLRLTLMRSCRLWDLDASVRIVWQRLGNDLLDPVTHD